MPVLIRSKINGLLISVPDEAFPVMRRHFRTAGDNLLTIDTAPEVASLPPIMPSPKKAKAAPEVAESDFA